MSDHDRLERARCPACRKQIDEREERVMAIKFVSEISIRKPREVGQMVSPPTGPETKEPDR
jgi:hypothetical protein